MNRRSLRIGLLTAPLLCLAATLALADNTCFSCHVKQEGPPGDAARQWKTSIHFANGISCSDCHGGDPNAKEPGDAMDPAKGFKGKPEPTAVPNFCAKCHSAVRDNYVQSAHAHALFAGAKAPNCVTCHTSHQQQKVTLNLINPNTCGQCHTYERAAKLKEAMSGMEEELTATDARVNAVFLEGLDVDQETKALFAVRNRTHRLTHVLDVSRILGELTSVRPDLVAVEKRVQAKERTVKDRKVLGTALMGFFLVGAAVAWATHKQFPDASHNPIQTPEEDS